MCLIKHDLAKVVFKFEINFIQKQMKIYWFDNVVIQLYLNIVFQAWEGVMKIILNAIFQILSQVVCSKLPY